MQCSGGDAEPSLTTRDVADRFGVSTEFVVGEIRAGRLDASVIERDGRRRVYRVSEQSVARYLSRFSWTPRPI